MGFGLQRLNIRMEQRKLWKKIHIIIKDKMMDYNIFKTEVHELAVEKGWYDTPREIEELILLVQSELFEAFECWRNNDLRTRYESRKPCGLPSEFADMVIRFLDMAGYYNIIIKIPTEMEVFDLDDFKKWIFKINRLLCNHEYYFNSEFTNRLISEIENMAEYMKIDLELAIIEKHNYNKTRPYRHGNKLA